MTGPASTGLVGDDVATGDGHLASVRAGVLWLLVAVAVVLGQSLSAGPIQDAHMLAALPVAIGIFAIVTGLVVRRPATADAWILLATGRVAVFAAELDGRAALAWDGSTHTSAQVIRLIGHAMTAGGLIVLARHLTRVWDRTRWIDSVAVSVSVGLAGSATLVWPFLPAGVGWLERWLIPSFPALDLLLVLLATRSLLATRPRSSSLKLLTAAFTIALVGDVVALWAAPAGAAVPPSIRSWSIGAASLLIGAAALVPSVDDTPRRVIPWRRLGSVRFTVLTASLILPLSALVGLARAGEVPAGTIAYLALGAAGIGVLVLVRVSGLVDYADALADERHRSRFEALANHSHDAVAIVDRDGLVSWASPAVRSVLALTPATLVGKPLDDMFGPGGASAMSELLATLANQDLGATADVHASVTDGKGRERIVEGVATNLLGEPSVEGLVVVVRDVTERSVLQELAEQAFFDPLTGLANRKLLAERIGHALTEDRRGDMSRIAVLFIDLDDFKIVNDTLGHSCGDELLVAVGQRLTASIGSGDTAARLGGDEFGVLLQDLTSAHAVDGRTGSCKL